MSWGRRWGLGGPAQCHQARGTALPGSRIHYRQGVMPRPTCVHCTPLGKGETVRLPTPFWALRLGAGVMRAGWGFWRKGGGTLSWASTIPPSRYRLPLSFPLPLLCLGPGLGPPLFLSPGSSEMVSTSFTDGPNHLLPPPGSRRLPAPLFQSPPLNPTRGSSV